MGLSARTHRTGGGTARTLAGSVQESLIAAGGRRKTCAGVHALPAINDSCAYPPIVSVQLDGNPTTDPWQRCCLSRQRSDRASHIFTTAQVYMEHVCTLLRWDHSSRGSRTSVIIDVLGTEASHDTHRTSHEGKRGHCRPTTARHRRMSRSMARCASE